MTFELHPIGIIRTPFDSSRGVPIQSFKSQIHGHAEIIDKYVDGLKSLDGFSHIILLYWFHKAKEPIMRIKPYLDSKEHGLFATRAPARPNRIGLSIVKIEKISRNTISFSGADMLDGSPLLDIKPFVPEFDNRLDATSGWLAESTIKSGHNHHADDRFES